MNNGKIDYLIQKDITPHTVVTQIVNEVENIDEIYCVVKNKEGDWVEIMSGTHAGLAFAALCLQKYWGETV